MRDSARATQDLKRLVEAFNLGVERGEFATETVPCLCGSGDTTPVARYDHYGLWSPVVICRHCGLIFASPRLTAEAYNFFYSSDSYRVLYEGENYLEQAKERFTGGYGLFIYEEVAPFLQLRRLSKIFELGCAGGWNLWHFYHQGYEVAGLDYSPSLVALGREQGLNLQVGSIPDIQGKYDVIILSHVVEHLPDVLTSVNQIASHLNNNGIMYISLPDMDNFSMAELQNAHVYYFSCRTFIHYMHQCGLKLVKFGPSEVKHMFGIFEVTGSKPVKISLEGEYGVLMRKIRKAKMKYHLVNLLHWLGIKEVALRVYHRVGGYK